MSDPLSKFSRIRVAKLGGKFPRDNLPSGMFPKFSSFKAKRISYIFQAVIHLKQEHESK